MIRKIVGIGCCTNLVLGTQKYLSFENRKNVKNLSFEDIFRGQFWRKIINFLFFNFWIPRIPDKIIETLLFLLNPNLN